ncbi:hypothetical protein R1flu_005643 [Riccia fluitans]|uniref:Carbohydrate kinase PfkB domain-containing protein n=1 Tax=Riccia fluitans TaxID=41844 RepID=A0ABD1YWI0_9MARC
MLPDSRNPPAHQLLAVEEENATPLQAQGDGNVGNALTAAARLGLSPRIFSKVGKDAAGIRILEELEGDGVDVSHVVCR